MAMKAKPVIHRIDPQKNSFTDITHEFGDVTKLSATELAEKMADYAKSRGLDSKVIINEFVAG